MFNPIEWLREQQERKRAQGGGGLFGNGGMFEGGLLGPFRAQQRRQEAMTAQGWGQAGDASGAMGGDYGRLFGPSQQQAGLLGPSPATPSFSGGQPQEQFGGGTASMFAPTPQQQTMLGAMTNAPDELSMPALGQAGKGGGLSNSQRMGLLSLGASMMGQDKPERVRLPTRGALSAQPTVPVASYEELMGAYGERDERKRLAMLRQLGVL